MNSRETEIVLDVIDDLERIDRLRSTTVKPADLTKWHASCLRRLREITTPTNRARPREQPKLPSMQPQDRTSIPTPEQGNTQ